MELGLANKVAWVLGASSGIGRAAAESLAREGALVAVSARGKGRLEATAAEIRTATGSRCVAVPLDVADVDAIPDAARLVEQELGPVDVLLSNSGGPPPGAFDDLDSDAMRTGFMTTTAAAWHLAKAVTPSMKERKTGVLLFLTSWSTKEIIEGLLLSNMMRAAVVGMAKTLSKELGPHGIRVLCVAPGKIDTPRLKELDNATSARTGKSVEEVRAEMAARLPLGRYGRPEEVGDVIAFLASERASYVSGISVVVDGGLLNGLLS